MDKQTVIKKANESLKLAKKEIEFGKWLNSLPTKTQLKLSLIPLIDYYDDDGMVDIPKPPGFKKWSKKNADKRININQKSTVHHVLVYPRLRYTLYDKYWSVSKTARYEMTIQFLNTIRIMAQNNFYNPDIHSKNIMFGKPNR